jgi:hypothetical protein
MIGSAVLAFASVAACAAAPAARPGADKTGRVIHVDHGPNALLQQRKHYVVLVSIDALRWENAKRDDAKHILSIAEHGASAPQGMIPAYPSLTFPNHYTIVTGQCRPYEEVQPGRSGRRRRRKLVWRRAAVGAGRAAGHALRLLFLAGL